MNFTLSLPKVESLHLFGNGLINKCFEKKHTYLGKLKVKKKTGGLYNNLLFSFPNIIS